MTREAYKATEAVEFIAEHLQNEDKYIQVRFITDQNLFYFQSFKSEYL